MPKTPCWWPGTVLAPYAGQTIKVEGTAHADMHAIDVKKVSVQQAGGTWKDVPLSDEHHHCGPFGHELPAVQGQVTRPRVRQIMASDIDQEIQTQYGSVARSGLSSDHGGVRAVAEAFGYTPHELAAIPAEANMGLSCGNPTAYATLRPGETVVDLGCGGGMDVFLAAQKVGPAGRAIGIDMTKEMLELARRNAERGIGGKPFTNVEFLAGNIDDLPLDHSTVDVVISNCVINLAPDKPAVFREIFRVLKPGGRLAVSDIALKKPLPPELGENLSAYIGCIAGAVLVEVYRRGLQDAGFSHVVVADTGADLNAYNKVEGQSGCCSPAMPSTSKPVPVAGGCCGGSDTPATNPVHGGLSSLSKQYDLNEYAASVRVYAVKPAAAPGSATEPAKEAR